MRQVARTGPGCRDYGSRESGTDGSTAKMKPDFYRVSTYFVYLKWPPRVVGELAGAFPEAQFAIEPDVGYYPWLDDATRLVSTVAANDAAAPRD